MVHLRPLRGACLPRLPWCGRAGGGGGVCLRRGGALAGREISRAAWCAPAAPAGCFPDMSALVAGMPEAVAGPACAWVVHLRGV
ncbi:MAG: hypothetical protein MSQ05_01280 [Akkermansia sp.]|nr:hypothetical protein [Akkermansia sp.]